MPLYLSQHTLACLTRQGADALAQRFLKMFCEFRAESREVLEAWLKSEGMHFDWLLRIEWLTSGGPLQPAV